MDKEKKFMSAVIYVHNAEDEVGKLIKELISFLESSFEESEIICVNDYSDDGSVNAIKEAGKTACHSVVSVLNMSFFHGVEAAMNAGTDIAIGDYILEIDTPYQDFHMEDIMTAYRKVVIEGFDIVSASSDKRERLSSKIFYSAYAMFSDENIMHTETFRILSRRAVNRVGNMSRTIPYRKALYMNCGLKTANIRYQSTTDSVERKKDRQLRKYRGKLAVDTLLLFTDAGYFISKMLSLCMMLISLFMGIYTVAVYLMAKPVAGWTTTVLFLSAAFFGLFVILTIIIKYLQILLGLTFRKMRYSFESIEKISK